MSDEDKKQSDGLDEDFEFEILDQEGVNASPETVNKPKSGNEKEKPFTRKAAPPPDTFSLDDDDELELSDELLNTSKDTLSAGRDRAPETPAASLEDDYDDDELQLSDELLNTSEATLSAGRDRDMEMDDISLDDDSDDDELALSDELLNTSSFSPTAGKRRKDDDYDPQLDDIPTVATTSVELTEDAVDDDAPVLAVGDDDELALNPELDNIETSTSFKDKVFDDEPDIYEDALIRDEDEFEEKIKKGGTSIHDAITDEEIRQAQSKPAEKDPFEDFLTEASKTGEFSAIQFSAEDLQKSTPTEDEASQASEITDDNDNPDMAEGKDSDKSFAEKLIGDVEEFIGINLPNRELSLNFKFPVPKPKKEIGAVPAGSEIRDIFNQKTTAAYIFEKAENELNVIVRTKLGYGKRKGLLDVFKKPFLNKLNSIITSYEKKPSIPDDPHRQAAIINAQKGLAHLITGYKQLYTNLYKRSNYSYGPKRKQANSIAYTIFELIYIELKLMGCLYKRLPASSINTANKMFNILWLYETDFIDEKVESPFLDHAMSIREMFIHVQLGITFDLMSFSATQHSLVRSYLAHHIPLLSFSDSSQDQDGTAYKWVIPHDHNEAPLIQKQVRSPETPYIAISIQPLFDSIKKDYKECLTLLDKKKAQHSSPVLALKKMGDCLSLLSILDAFVKRIENNEKLMMYSAYQSIDLQVYAGFKECFMYFKDMNDGREDKRELKDSLAKRSSFMSEGRDEKGGTLWYCAMEDEKSMYLQTTETKFTVTMDIGWLILIIRKDPEGNEEITLGHIERAERTQGEKVNLIIRKLGFKATNISFKSSVNTPSDAGKLLPGMITVREDARFFITANNDRFWKGRQFDIIMPNKKKAPVVLDELQAASYKFQVFKLV